MTYREKTPQTISILTRKLKPGKTFDDFQKAHLPPGDATKTEFGYDVDYFPVPTRVLNCVSALDPSLIISIGFSYGDPKEVFEAVEKKMATEKGRRDEIEEVADFIGLPQIYFVASDNNYAGANPTYEQGPLAKLTPELFAGVKEMFTKNK